MPVTEPDPQQPPRAARIPHRVQAGGRSWDDPYFWLRERDDPAVRAYLEAENAWTERVMAGTGPLRERLYREMLARIRETDQDVPYRDGAYLYYHRTEAGLEYPVFCRRALGPDDAPEVVLLDLNALARGHDYLGLGAFDPDPAGGLLAYSLDTSGFREYTLQVKDLASGQLLPWQRSDTRSVAWSADGSVLFYVTEDEAKRACRLWRHRLAGGEDELVLEETDERFSLGVHLTRSRAHVVITSASATTSEVWTLPAHSPDGQPRSVCPRQAGIEYYVDHHGTRFYILANDRGRNFRLVSAPVHSPGPGHWVEHIAHDPAVMLEGLDLFARRAVLHQRRDGLPQLRVLELDTFREHLVTFPEPAYALGGDANAEFDTDVFRFRYESLVTPEAVYDYDLATGERQLLKQREVLGGYDPARYACARLQAQAADGTAIGISLVWAKAMRGSGPAPMLLTGYGAYGFALEAEFSSTRLSLLDRGVVYAIAHVRGGGEMGKRWHEEGRLLAKPNTFSDFIAVAEHLVAAGWTAPDRLVIEGGSAGGLLVTAVANQRPELFRAVVAQVPFVDVVNTMLDASLPLTTGEYEEWGNPADPDALACMLGYSPYDNIRACAYPALLVETSLNDSQVMYWEPAKYVARLRATATGDAPLLLRTNLEAGHGGASGRYEYLREIAFSQAFVLWQLGLADIAGGRQP